jgi:hypothetical protein
MKRNLFTLFLAAVISTSLFSFSTQSVRAEGVQPTPYRTILWGHVSLNGIDPAPVGTHVEFRTSGNVVAGEATVETDGELMLTQIFGADGLGTPGFIYGEPISVWVNGQKFAMWPNVDWFDDKDEHEVVITPITKTINLTITGGPRFLSFTTDTKVLVHATSCNGAIAREIDPGTTVLDSGNSPCPGSTWTFFEFIALEQGQQVIVTPDHLIGWGIGASPYLWIWERKSFSQVFFPLVAK